MSYLVTGYPRSRTAWFAALCFAHGSPCCHEPNVLFPTPPPDGWQGLDDPGLIVEVDPARGAIGRALDAGYQGVALPFNGSWSWNQTAREIKNAGFDRILIIERDYGEANQAAVEAGGDRHWRVWPAAMSWLRDQPDLIERATSASYYHLNDLDVIEYCLRSIGIEPVAETIRALQLLQVEQNMAKARAALEGFYARP